jgi:5-methylcytosine-specific restriction endonuclease McrA
MPRKKQIRRCCGIVLPPKFKYCDSCRRKARVRSAQESLRRRRERSAEDAQRHAEYHAAYIAKYRQARKDDPAWRAKNAEKEQRRRARKRGARIEPYTRQEVWERDEGICGSCGLPAEPSNWHLDHIVPLGPGADVLDNVRVTHPACNAAKIPDDKRALATWGGELK